MLIQTKVFSDYIEERARWREVFVVFPRHVGGGRYAFLQKVYRKYDYIPTSELVDPSDNNFKAVYSLEAA